MAVHPAYPQRKKGYTHLSVQRRAWFKKQNVGSDYLTPNLDRKKEDLGPGLGQVHLSVVETQQGCWPM